MDPDSEREATEWAELLALRAAMERAEKAAAKPKLKPAMSIMARTTTAEERESVCFNRALFFLPGANHRLGCRGGDPDFMSSNIDWLCWKPFWVKFCSTVLYVFFSLSVRDCVWSTTFIFRYGYDVVCYVPNCMITYITLLLDSIIISTIIIMLYLPFFWIKHNKLKYWTCSGSDHRRARRPCLFDRLQIVEPLLILEEDGGRRGGVGLKFKNSSQGPGASWSVCSQAWWRISETPLWRGKGNRREVASSWSPSSGLSPTHIVFRVRLSVSPRSARTFSWPEHLGRMAIFLAFNMSKF